VSDRQTAREIHEEGELDFLEVYVNTTLAECEHRDPKGLYARAREGDIKGFTGVDAPYEVPARPDVELLTAEHNIEELVDQLVAALQARGVLGERPRAEGAGA
jgi:adenylylsulfate kinase-like enzyme